MYIRNNKKTDHAHDVGVNSIHAINVNIFALLLTTPDLGPDVSTNSAPTLLVRLHMCMSCATCKFGSPVLE